MSRAFGAGDGVRREDEEHVATPLRMKGPLDLLKELAAARSDQVFARKSRDDIRLLQQPIANNRLSCKEIIAGEQSMTLLQKDLIVLHLLNERLLGSRGA